MRLCCRGLLLLLALAVLLAQPAGVTPVGASDTAHHQTSTDEALKKAGFSTSAIGVATVGEWYVDFYQNGRLYGDVKKNVGELHFDNLFTLDDIEKRFEWLEAISKKKLAEMKSGGTCDSFGILMLMGIIFHALQDFYSHSNWAPKFLDDEIWSDWEKVPRANRSGLYTGWYPESRWQKFWGPPSGTTRHDVMHIDHSGRDNFDTAQAQATKEKEFWVGKFKEWLADDACWENVKNWPVSGDPQDYLVKPSTLSQITPLQQELSQMEGISRGVRHWDGPSLGWGITSDNFDRAASRADRANREPNVFDAKFQWIVGQMDLKISLVERSVILVVDASGSMGDPIPNDPQGRRKIDGAKEAIIDMLGNLSDGTEAAVMAYFGCGDIQIQPFTMDKESLIEEVEAIEPSGDTDMFGSIEAARMIIQYGMVSSLNVEGILLSDGEHNCSGEPIEAAESWHSEPIDLPASGTPMASLPADPGAGSPEEAPRFVGALAPAPILQLGADDTADQSSSAETFPVLHTIGFGVDSAAEEQLRQVASAGGGNYYSATSAQDLTWALGQASGTGGGGGNEAVFVLLVGLIVGGGAFFFWLRTTGARSA